MSADGRPDPRRAAPSEALRQAVVDALPALAGAALEPFGDGVDNRAYAAGGWVVRHARNRRAARFLEREWACLPRLPALPIPFPRPAAFGEADGRPFLVHRLLRGRSAEGTPPTAELGARLGAFVRALHATTLDVDAPALPAVGKTDWTLARRQLVRWGHPETARVVDGLVPAKRLVWVHGDLYPRHVRLDGDARVSAIIDWGDLHRGDPALDFAIVVGWMPPPARAAFLEAYGAIDVEAQRRARFYARYYTAAFEMLGRTRPDAGLAELAGVYRRRISDRPLDVG